MHKQIRLHFEGGTTNDGHPILRCMVLDHVTGETIPAHRLHLDFRSDDIQIAGDMSYYKNENGIISFEEGFRSDVVLCSVTSNNQTDTVKEIQKQLISNTKEPEKPTYTNRGINMEC